MKHHSGLKISLLSVLAVFALSGGGLATVAAWQDTLTVGDATVTSGEGWGRTQFAQISADTKHTVAIDISGNAWAWGGNTKGQLGDGTNTDRHTPVQVLGGHKFTQITTGYYHTIAIDINGDTWAWGWNNYGQLGDGTTNNRNTPTLVAGGHKFAQISAGLYHTVALDTNGGAWAWGYNDKGQLGDGVTTTNRNTPTPVAGGTGLPKYRQATRAPSP